MCTPGFQALGGRDDAVDGVSIGAWEYGLPRDTGGVSEFVRWQGWRGPMPRECPQRVDSINWYLSPRKAGVDGRRVSHTEPDWSQQR